MVRKCFQVADSQRYQTTKTRAVLCRAFVACYRFASAADEPANVAGTWSAEQTIFLKQEGAKITGTFKGPRQSGPLEGTVEATTSLSTWLRVVPLDYKGTVDGDTMKGTMMGNGKTGDWTAAREVKALSCCLI